MYGVVVVVVIVDGDPREMLGGVGLSLGHSRWSPGHAHTNSTSKDLGNE